MIRPLRAFGLTQPTRLSATLGLVLLAACKNDYKAEDSQDSEYAFHDTEEVVDTNETADSDTEETDTEETDTDSVDSDTGPTDTSDTGVAPSWTRLELYPSAIVVDVGATWAERAVSTSTDGTRTDAVGVVWSVDDITIASVDADGMVTGLAVGTTTLHGVLGGLDTPVAIEVRDDNVMTVTVYDGSTGLPIADAKVKTDVGSVRTDAAGVATASVTDGSPATVTAYVDETYSMVSYMSVTSRSVIMTLWPQDLGGKDATLHGNVSFTGVRDPAWNELTVGVVVPSQNRPLALLTTDDLFASDRDVSVFGIETGMPANLVIEGSAEDYYCEAWPGAVGSWGFAGPIAYADASSGISSTADALALMIAYMPFMTWSYSTGATAATGTQSELDLAPDTAFSEGVTVLLPPLTVGFHGDESMLVFTADQHVDDGWMVTGIDMGTTSALVSTVPSGSVLDTLDSGVLAYVEVGGIGTGGASASSFASLASDGTVTLPDFQDVAVVDAWDPSTSTIGVTTDSDSDIVRVRLTDNHHHVYDMFLPSGAWSGTLPSAVSSFGKANATIEVTAVHTLDGVYDGWLSSGAVDFAEMTVETTARTVQ